jgi:spore coat protein U-like protein
MKKGGFMNSAVGRVAGAVAAVAALCTGGAAWAGSAVTDLTVSATVTQRCTITTTPVAFGSYDPVLANRTSALPGTGQISLTCTKGSANITVSLDDGTNFSGGFRRMSSGGGTPDFLRYRLDQPIGSAPGTCPGTQEWRGFASPGLYTAVATWSALTAFTFNVCGTVPAGQDVTGSSAGTAYTDTVLATVNF